MNTRNLTAGLILSVLLVAAFATVVVSDGSDAADVSITDFGFSSDSGYTFEADVPDGDYLARIQETSGEGFDVVTLEASSGKLTSTNYNRVPEIGTSYRLTLTEEDPFNGTVLGTITAFSVHEVTFDAGVEGYGTMSSVIATGVYTLPDCGFTSDDYEFAGWQVNGSGDALPAGEHITVSSDIELVAIWTTGSTEEPITVTVEGVSDYEISPETVYAGDEVRLTINPGEKVIDTIVISPETRFTLNGNVCTFTPAGDVTVTVTLRDAEKETVTVTFDPNGGTGTEYTQTIPVGEMTALIENTFTRDGYTFTGWNTAADGTGTPYGDRAEVTLTEDLTLYAQWTPNTVTEYTVHIESVDHVTITVMAGDRTITDGDEVADGTELTITYKVETGYSMTGSTGPTVKVDGADVTITATVEQILVKEIDIDKPTLSLKVGGTESLSVTVTPEDALDRSVSWASSDNNVVTVDQDGNVTAVGVGPATITVTANDGSGVSAVCEVTVTAADVPSYDVDVGTTEGEGTVTVSQGSVPQGGVVSYTVSPAYGWIVQSVKVNGVDQEITGATGFTGRYTVASDVTIDVVFVEDTQHQAIVTAGDHGGIGAGGATSAQVTVYGHWATTVIIDPDNGYRVSKITPDQDAKSISYEDGVLTIAAGSTVTKIDIAFEQIPVSDDDEEYVPPVITVIPGDDDDSTTYIVAIAAGVVVAILAALILMQTRKS